MAEIAGEGALTELLETQLVREDEVTGNFRDGARGGAPTPTCRGWARCLLHRALAEALDAAESLPRGRPDWAGLDDDARARAALLRAAAESEAVHAYRDAAESGRLALERWPAGDDDAGLGRRAGSADPRPLHASLPASSPRRRAPARADRRRRRIRPGRRRAAPARRRAPAARRPGCGDGCATRRRDGVLGRRPHGRRRGRKRLAIANQQRLSGRHGEVIELARSAGADAERADRLDLRVRAMGIEGMARAKHGEYPAGLAIVRDGLALALEHDLTAVAAEVYQRLSVTLYESADYAAAEEA